VQTRLEDCVGAVSSPLPAAQSEVVLHEVAPVASWYSSNPSHERHDVWPPELVYCPDGHEMHTRFTEVDGATLWYEPAVQAGVSGVQTKLVSAFEYVPAEEQGRGR
jgi:hypothetical protein